MTDRPQPWYTPGPPQQPVPGNPYAQDGSGPPPGSPPPPPPRRRRFGGAPVLAVAVVLLLVAAAGGVYAVTDGTWGRSAGPVAKESPGPASSAPASSAPPPGAPAARTPQPQKIPTTAEIDAARKPGDATAWIVDDRTDLPKGNHRAHDLWTVDGAVVQALHRKVAAYRLSDGAELWSVPLPTAVCETPANPAPDGKVVIVRQERPDDERGNRCNQLQMIDLKSGKQGWHKQLPETGSGDNSFIVYSAISGGTFAIARSMKATAYRVADGSELYDIPWENPGKCYPDDVAGGSRLLVSSDCAISMDRSKNYSRLREINPRTGKVLWRHRTSPGRQFGSLISVDPVVFTTVNAEDTTSDWPVVALGPKGKLRTSVWGIKSDDPLRTLHPLRAEKGRAALVYESASPDGPGRTFVMGPGGAGTEKVLLKHPAAAAAAETRMAGGRLAYMDGRVVVTSSGVSGLDTDRQARMLSFAPARP
ncbi:Secreted protein [Streptomyces sp. CBMAI 2042]|uniref:outer membrane protein assembly factor BamB family protein n=1 Tax=Streptomyces sp. CBMAI 2042 TaxID=2305222 RepID=UPI000F0E640A|nr:PQQ-binding-like beta-propeller repeat protein [Streptomyces sp. CBMAI 2042]RLV68969.1 Secreted protein [Streptomyces sp. CBMAI 2042]